MDGGGRKHSAWDAVGDACVRAWGLLAGGSELATRPVRRMFRSHQPLDAYALVHLASVAGDALVTVALADTVFFSVPVGEAKLKVALYLGLTMAPLAIASPLLVPLLDRGGHRRVISAASAAGRAAATLVLAASLSTALLFPFAFAVLVLSKVHGLTKNGLTMAYAQSREGLVQANARLGRVAVVSAVSAGLAGAISIRLDGGALPLRLATLAYTACVLLTMRLPQPDPVPARHSGVARLGRLPSLAPAAVGAAGLRGASGFLLFLLAFALRGGGQPRYWFGILAAAALAGGFVGDLVAPRLPAALREERIVLASIVAAGLAAVFALASFHLWTLALFCGLAGTATELGRLAFQSLMQRSAPGGAQGRVFVRYEVAFQLAWVGGALLPAVLPISFRAGVIVLAVFYLALGPLSVARARPGKGLAGGG